MHDFDVKNSFVITLSILSKPMSDVLSYVFFFVFIFEELVHDRNNPMLQRPQKDCIGIRKNTVGSELSISTALSTVLGFLALYITSFLLYII